MRSTRGMAVALAAAACARGFDVPAPPGPGSISGRLVYAVPNVFDPQPAAKATIQLQHTNVSAVASDSGRFTLSPILSSTGTLLIRFDSRHDGSYAMQRYVELADLAAGPGHDVAAGDLMLRENAIVHGRVLRGDHATDPSGHKGSVVYVPEGPFQAATGDDGTFVLPNVPEGSLTIAFFRDGYDPQSIVGVQVRGGESLTLRDVVLNPSPAAPTAVTVNGSLRFDPPVADARSATVTAGTRTLPVAADGTFSDSLQPGLYDFSFSMSGYTGTSISNLLVITPITIPPVTLTQGQTVLPDAGPPPIGPPPPEARIGSPSVGAAGQRFVLDGSPSSGTPGHQLRFSWRQTAGATVALEVNDSPSAVQTGFIAPSTPGTLSFALTVLDTVTALDAVAGTTIQFFDPPVAAISSPTTGRAGGAFQLDGSASSGPHALTFSWRQTQGEHVSLDSTTSARPLFVAPLTPQTLGFELTATDPVTALSATAPTLIAFQDAPIAAVSAPATAVAGAQVTLDASLSTGPPSHTLSFSWRQSGGLSVILSANDSPSAAVVTFTAPAFAEQVLFGLTVTDMSTGITATAAVAVTIEVPPQVQIPPLLPQRTGATVQVTAVGDTLTGNLMTWHWSANPPVTFSDNDTATAFQTTFVAPSTAGFVVLTATATDVVTGLQGSGNNSVFVTAPPVAVISSPPPTVKPGTTFTLDGSKSVTGPPPFGFEWTISGATDAVFVPNVGISTDPKPTITAGTQPFTVTLIIFGAYLQSDPASINVTIDANAAPANPNLTMPPYTVAASGSTVTLTASATDTTSNTFSWSWSQTSGPAVTLVTSQTPDTLSSSAVFTAPNSTGLLSFSAKVTAGDGGTATGSVTVELRDQTPPHVIAFDPAVPGGFGSAFYARMTYDKALDPATVNASTVGILGSAPVPVDVRYDNGTRTVTLLPRTLLTPGNTYTLHSGSGVTDTASPPNAAVPAQLTYTARSLAFRTWSSEASTVDAAPGITVTPAEVIAGGQRRDARCSGHRMTNPGSTAALVDQPFCLGAPQENCSTSVSTSVRRMHVVGATAYAQLVTPTQCTTAAQVSLVKRTSTGWASITNSVGAPQLFSDGTFLRAIGFPCCGGLSFWTYSPGSDSWSAEPISTGLGPFPYEYGGGAGEGRTFAHAWSGDSSLPCLSVYERLSGSWSLLPGASTASTGSIDCSSRPVVSSHIALAAHDPVVAFPTTHVNTTPLQLDVAHWSTGQQRWTYLKNVGSGAITGNTDLAVRGDAAFVAYVAQTDSTLHVSGADLSAASPAFTPILGPNGTASWNDDLAGTATCAADHPEMFLADDALWVTWEEQCTPGEWRVIAREMSGSVLATGPGLDANHTGKSCKDLQAQGVTADGAYWIDPTGFAAFPVWCDMTTDDGGWTLASGIAGTTNSHVNGNVVGLGGLVSTTAPAKLDDATINTLKSGTDPAFRLTCTDNVRTITGFFRGACVFNATADASGACTSESYTYPPTSYGTGMFSQSGITGLADGDSGIGNRLAYGSPAQIGCNSGVGWTGNGTLWVR